MKIPSQATRTALLLAALIPFSAAVFAADPSPTPAPAPETPLHEIGAVPSPAPALKAIPSPTSLPTADPDSVTPTAEPYQNHHHHDDDDDNRVSVGDSTLVAANETVPGNAVAVMGNLRVDGTVEGNAVAILGESHIEGTVHGNAVVVLGKLYVGSHAHIDGNLVAGVGMVTREPGSYVGGAIVQQGSKLDFSDDSAASNWWTHGLRMGRPLAIGHHLAIFWFFNACFIALYVLLAMLFPTGARKCGETLARRPGITFLTGILGMIATPVVFILLCVTVVGIPVALLVLPLAILCCVVFGRASIYALVGRAIIGKEGHPALATLVGALVFVAIYLIPVLGIMVWIVMAFLSFACSVTALVAPEKAPAAPVTAPVGMVVPPVVAPASAVVAPVEPGAAPLVVPGDPASPQAAPAAALPVAAALTHVPEASLPRAGFWVRMVALLIDAILIGAITHMSHVVLPVLAAYAAVLWRYKGSTIGGIIFGVKVVRLDGRPVDWITSVVRALACFISLIAIGLGFIWIAFDPEKQGWHDKIAGTVVVKLPKGTSLV
jgi:uncharacterized RDD family membrane protein YckC